MPLDDTIHDIGALGGLPFFLLMTALIALGRDGWLPLLITLLLGLVACFTVTAAIRWLWFRQRPVPQQHSNWFQRIDASSFPSLHAMRAAFLATVIIILARFSIAVVVASVLVTVAVCWARVRMKKHHISDVVVGAVLGVIMALAAMVLMVVVPTWF